MTYKELIGNIRNSNAWYYNNYEGLYVNKIDLSLLIREDRAFKPVQYSGKWLSAVMRDPAPKVFRKRFEVVHGAMPVHVVHALEFMEEEASFDLQATLPLKGAGNNHVIYIPVPDEYRPQVVHMEDLSICRVLSRFNPRFDRYMERTDLKIVEFVE